MTCHLQHGPAAPVYLVDENGQAIGGTIGVALDDGWELILLSDTALNDSDKSFTVPSGYYYQVLWIYVALTTSGTAGARQLVVETYDSLGQRIFSVRAGATQAASLTYYYTFAPSMADLTAVRDTTFLMTPLPPTLILYGGQQIRIRDNKPIDAAADDMSTFIQCARKVI